MMRYLVRKRRGVLREEFPQWRIRVAGGRWLAARDGFPLVVRDLGHELRGMLRFGRRRAGGGR